MPISLCVVNYNGERYLEESLGSIFAYVQPGEVLLIDNASQDRSLQIVRERFPRVKIIRLDKNYGPGAARNAGFKAATWNRILFIDNDVSLAPGCLDQLEQALDKHPDAAVAMPRVLYAWNKDMIQYDGADSHFLGLMALHHPGQPLATASTEIRAISSVVTACFMLDRRRWGKVEPFDEMFFTYYEDHDFGLRTRTLGHEIVAAPTACVYHREGTAGLSFREGGTYSRRRIYYLIRNRWQIILKNYAFRTLLLLAPVFFLYEIFQLVGVVKKGWLGEWFKACFWIGRNFRQLLQRRRLVQQARKASDRQILQAGPVPFTKDLTKNPVEQLGKQILDRLTATYWKQIQRFI